MKVNKLYRRYDRVLKNKVIGEKKTIEQAIEQMYRHIEKFDWILYHHIQVYPGNPANAKKTGSFAAISRYRGLAVKG